MTINQLNEAEDGGVEIRGRMLTTFDKAAIYAAVIVSAKNTKKDIKIVGPSNIQFDKNSMNFLIHMEGPLEGVFYSDDPKVLELYIRTRQTDKI